jgi:hypothetical protein
MLEAKLKQRYARHLLLAEIGEAGQMRLAATRVFLPAEADPRALAVARDYLERAGLATGTSGAVERDVNAHVLDAAAVSVLAGRAELEEAAAALAGAFAAVEAVKSALGVGVPAQLPKTLELGVERA